MFGFPKCGRLAEIGSLRIPVVVSIRATGITEYLVAIAPITPA
jgi:hypothetical protein